MKSLTIIAIVFFVSCSNPKSKIVEQIKAYKDSSGMISAQIVLLSIDDSKKYEEIFYINGEPDYNKVRDNNLRNQYNEYHAKNEGQKWDLKFKKANYQGKIDSLELELKKY